MDMAASSLVMLMGDVGGFFDLDARGESSDDVFSFGALDFSMIALLARRCHFDEYGRPVCKSGGHGSYHQSSCRSYP